MSSAEESDCRGEDHGQQQINFVNLLTKHKSVLQKSQIPSVKKAKDDALRQLREDWEAETGKLISEKQISKKINNMKMKIKKKTDLNKTGNRKVKLSKWEQIFFELLEGDKNPTCAKIPGKNTKGKLCISDNLTIK